MAVMATSKPALPQLEYTIVKKPKLARSHLISHWHWSKLNIAVRNQEGQHLVLYSFLLISVAIPAVIRRLYAQEP